MNAKQDWGLVKGAASAWIDDYAPSMGAALAYYTMLSIAPLLLIVISIAGLVFGEEAARKGQGKPAATETKAAPAHAGAAGRPGVPEAVPERSSRA